MTDTYFRFSWVNSIGARLFIYVLSGALVGLSGMAFFFHKVLEEGAKNQIVGILNTQVSTINSHLIRVEESMVSLASAVVALRTIGSTTTTDYKKLAFTFFQSRSPLVVGNGFGQAPFQVVPDREWYWPYFYVDQGAPDAVGEFLPPPYDNIRFADLFTDDNYPQQNYYTLPVKAQQAVWSEPYDWRGIVMTSFLYPFYDHNRQLLGVAGADVNATALTQHLNIPVLGQVGYFVILSEQGNLLAYPPAVTQARTLTSYREVATLNQLWGLIQQEQGLLEIGDEFWSYQRIPSTRWIMLAMVPKVVILRPLLFITLAGTLGAGVILALVVILFVKQLNRRLQPILKECQHPDMTTTDSNTNHDDNWYGLDEIEILARSFNNMTQQLKESMSILASKNQELQKLDQLKDEFLANTSHELRTPLNGIIGLTESLIDGAAGPLSEKTKLNLAMIVSSGKRLAALVNDILDFAKLKYKTIDLQLKPIYLREITEVVLFLNRPLVAKKSLQLVNAIAADLPPVHADENRLQQILHNLIGNAIKFTDNGEVKITARVHLGVIETTVADTGIGIPVDKQTRIFESFEQADGSTAREYGGTGLGLAVTKQLVELHGGHISVVSQVGSGSQFIFTLPLATTTAVAPTPLLATVTTVPTVAAVATDLAVNINTEEMAERFHVLMVDDEPVNLQVLNNFLSLQDVYHIVQATSGVEAIKLIEDGFKPDIILLDVMMPKMTGYEVTQKLREKWALNELPILLLTAKNRVEDLLTGLEAGANDYLTKPFSKDELLARIKTHLNVKRLQEENMRMQAQLEISRQLQQVLLPREHELEQIRGLEVAGFMEPAAEVGGDYYDVLVHAHGVKVGIGDVTGHGLESGILAMMVQTAVRTLLTHGETDAVKFLATINRTIYDNVQRMGIDRNLTLCLLDWQENQLRISGQHEEVLIVRQGQVDNVDTLDLGFTVGLEPEIAEFVAEKMISLNNGDVVILYTDGVTEAENAAGEFYGLARLCAVVSRHWQERAVVIKQAIIADVRGFVGRKPLLDDVTVVVLKQG